MDIETIKREGLEPNFEQIKEKGTLALAPEDAYRLRTYGFVPQKHPGYFILRIRIPSGAVTTRQLLALAELIETHGRGSAHLTFRQGLEMRFVRVEEAPEIFEKLQAIGLSSRSTDGHTIRNVMACPHGGIASNGLLDVRPWAMMLSDYFVQQSNRINPLLPNRLNIFFSACPQCNPYAMINDIAFVVTPHEQEEETFALWAGGSLGPSPRLGFKIRDLPISDTLIACNALISLYTEFGHSLKHPEREGTRLHNLIAIWGQDRFTATFNEIFIKEKAKDAPQVVLGEPEKQPALFAQFFEAMIPSFSSRLPEGAFLQRQKGYAGVKVAVPLGEIRATALVAAGRVANQYGNGMIHFTNGQAFEMHWIPIRKIGRVEKALSKVGLSFKGCEADIAACSGIEFCSQAQTNAQGGARELRTLVKLRDPCRTDLLRTLSIHLSGCTNGCARHHLSDIGFVGEMQEEGLRSSYRLYMGGGTQGGVQLAKPIRDQIPEEHIIPTVDILLGIILDHRQEGETVRDMVLRIGTEKIAALLNVKLASYLPQEETFMMSPCVMENISS